MRCPKCGFISFDHLSNCLSCNKSFNDLKDMVQGTAYITPAPAFLKIHAEPEQSFGDDIQISDTLDEEFEVQDPDLDILFEGEDAEGAQESGLRLEKDSDLDSVGEGFELAFESDKEEEEGISMDLGQFHDNVEDDSGSHAAQFMREEAAGLELPDELTDISDLAPPQKKNIPPAAKALDDDFDFSLDLDTDELKSRPAPAAKSATRAAALDLGEVDLSMDVKPKKAARKPAAKDSDMDGELDFELDLGDLSLDKD
ncbi:MAG: hypothetical protein F9K32_06325 [Desulfobulbaceae bacterium]|nr:MAG: hypothetical protein F9K32_06325 [Desulfobulbaceae bacterium]